MLPVSEKRHHHRSDTYLCTIATLFHKIDIFAQHTKSRFFFNFKFLTHVCLPIGITCTKTVDRRCNQAAADFMCVHICLFSSVFGANRAKRMIFTVAASLLLVVPGALQRTRCLEMPLAKSRHSKWIAPYLSAWRSKGYKLVFVWYRQMKWVAHQLLNGTTPAAKWDHTSCLGCWHSRQATPLHQITHAANGCSWCKTGQPTRVAGYTCTCTSFKILLFHRNSKAPIANATLKASYG